MTSPKLSIAFFGADAGSLDSDTRYERILEVCAHADEHGLHAVWIPERHFQDFGDVFPNPAVLAAAIAVRTMRIGIRAGSVVGPLHNPLRLTEDWSMVQALSGGRAGVSFAAGWNEKDFAINPSAFQDRRATVDDLVRGMRDRLTKREVLARLPDGSEVPVTPRPVPRRTDVPIWLTTSGTPRTWERAGEIGVGVLASTVGQTSDSLRSNIELYRRACAGSGAAPWVTVMAHTALGASRDAVRTEIEMSLKAYLRSFLAQSNTSQNERELTMLTDFAFERYWSQMSMLGTVESARRTVEQLGDIGCDEIACLIDFGPDHSSVLNTVENAALLQGELN